MSIKVELLCFGNELLIGQVINTNANWLGREFTQLGAVVTRITTLSDELSDIEMGFREALSRKPEIIISTGGLGPTWDDHTLIGLAHALNEPLERNQAAYNMIVAAYQKRNLLLNPAAEKMANFPRHGQALNNPVGTAPGLMYTYQSTTIFCLPGVPHEMKAIFKDSIKGFVQKLTTETQFYETKFYVSGLRESQLAPITAELTLKYPTIYIKSHPNHSILLHLTARGKPSLKKLMLKVKTELIQALENIGGSISYSEGE